MGANKFGHALIFIARVAWILSVRFMITWIRAMNNNISLANFGSGDAASEMSAKHRDNSGASQRLANRRNLVWGAVDTVK